MAVVSVGKNGEVHLPFSILQQLGLSAGSILLVEATVNGEIILHPLDSAIDVDLIETYTDERFADFARENELTDDERHKINRVLSRR